MIKPTYINGEVTLETTVNGIAIYLDNWAIISLAKDEIPSLRQRFLDVISGGADLLFSIANIAEVIGPQDDSSLEVKSFLNDLGQHWYPVEHNPYVFIEREKKGVEEGRVCLADDLLKAFVKDKLVEQSPLGSGKIVNLSDGFFSLGSFIDWLAPQRDWYQSQT